MNKYIGISLAAILLFSASCKKHNTGKTTSCTSTLYGYTVPLSTMYDSIASCNFGIINPATAVLSPSGTFSSSVYSNEAAYNTSDNCYYVFKTYMGDASSPAPLYKISTSGAVTALTNALGFAYSSLTYNRVTNKLYCISNGHLVEITTAATTFSTTNVVAPVHPFPFYSLATVVSLTVDNTTGDMYYVSGDTTMYYIEKYHFSSGTATVIASGTGAWAIMGLRFNKNDNMLYGIRINLPGATSDFIKINPAAGTITTITALTMGVNDEFYSATIDQCSNRYIFSTPVNSGTLNPYILDQLSMTGATLQEDTTATFYQGLDAQ